MAMEPERPHSTPSPGRTWLRVGDRQWEMDDWAWERWVQFDRVPPDALVLSAHWTRGLWRRADSLEVYHLFRASRGPAADAPSTVPARGVTHGLPAALWGRGVSVTQALLFANILISAVLVWRWGARYEPNLWVFSEALRDRLLEGWAFVLFVPLFLHASSSHLLGNMIGLVAGGAAVEEFYGRRRTLGLYIGAGLCGALLSLMRDKDVLSVGASGAIMGLYGVVLVFLLRYRHRFSDRQKLKTVRIYLPLLMLALFPSLLMADVYSHVGGFVGGVLLALLVPPRRDLTPWRNGVDPAADAGPQSGAAVRPRTGGEPQRRAGVPRYDAESDRPESRATQVAPGTQRDESRG